MNKCENCYFWSEMIAQSVGCGPVEAMCLNDNSDSYQEMVPETFGCVDWENGETGAIDCPWIANGG